MTAPPITWRDNDWIAAGTRVRLTHAPDDEAIAGYPHFGEPGGGMAYLRGGARGVVVRAPSGGHPAFSCPDHDLDPGECMCGADGMVTAKLPTARVEWELDNGAVLRQLLRYPGDGGWRWETVDDDAWPRVTVQP